MLTHADGCLRLSIRDMTTISGMYRGVKVIARKKIEVKTNNSRCLASMIGRGRKEKGSPPYEQKLDSSG